VQELHAGSVDRGDELGVGVERRLAGPPVVLLSPVVGELTQVSGGNAALPAGAGQVAGPAGPGQPLAEVVDVGLRDADAVRPDPGVGGGTGVGGGAGAGAGAGDRDRDRDKVRV
jgi:hypothetical protein